MVVCSNCHCDIEESKIFLHQRFCIQNIKYCEQCKEGIIREEYEEHCKNHNQKVEEPSKELKDNLTLKRVQSSKIGCEYCGYCCSFSEIEEHEAMCGAKTTKCKKCGKNLLIKNLKQHIEKEHNLKMDNYREMISGNVDFDNKNNSSALNENLKNLNLNRMTSEEEIAYALQILQDEEKKNNNKIIKILVVIFIKKIVTA